MNDVDEWLAETADMAQANLDRDAELRDQINLLLEQGKSPSCIRGLKHLAFTDAIVAIVVSRPPVIASEARQSSVLSDAGA